MKILFVFISAFWPVVTVWKINSYCVQLQNGLTKYTVPGCW